MEGDSSKSGVIFLSNTEVCSLNFAFTGNHYVSSGLSDVPSWIFGQSKSSVPYRQGIQVSYLKYFCTPFIYSNETVLLQ